MKKYFCLLGILILTFFIPYSVETSPLQLSKPAPTQGGLLVLTLDKQHCTPEVQFDTERIPTFRQSSSLVAIIGIDLETPPGPKNLTVTRGTCTDDKDFPITKTLRIKPGEFSVERLSISDTEKVVLSDEALRRHRRETKRIEQTLSQDTTVRHWTPGFHPPVRTDKFSPGNSFGSRRIINGHARSPHSGEDYSADAGDPIYTINHGTVALTGNFFFSGNSVFIDHGRGVFSMYFHLSTTTVEEDQFVNKGDLIGRAGATGRVTGPHLHLGIQWRNSKIDPDELYFEVPSPLESVPTSAGR